jgi:enterochelin esterase-like enzyme
VGKLLLPALTAAPGEIRTAAVRSATLGENIAYNVYLPAGYDESAQRYPVLYLLHGRGDTMAAWTQVKIRLDELIGAGEVHAGASGGVRGGDRTESGRVLPAAAGGLEHPGIRCLRQG